MTVGMFMCVTQNGEMCIPTCLSSEEAPRWMSMIWFSYSTLKSGDEEDQYEGTRADCVQNMTFTTALLSALWLVEQQRCSVFITY